MGRPLSHHDTTLLELIADLLVSGEAKTAAEAQRRAAACIPDFKTWQEHRQTQLFDRLGKKYSISRTELEQASIERMAQRKHMSWLPKFIPPTLLTMPGDPAMEQQSKEMLELQRRLKDVSAWATELSNLLRRQWLKGKVNSDLATHARDLVSLVQKEQAKMERKNSPH